MSSLLEFLPNQSGLLFYGGIVVCVTAVVVASVSAIVLRILKKRLNKRLDAEFGRRK